MNRIVTAVALTFALATTAAAQGGNPPQTEPSSEAAAASIVRKLSKRERTQRIERIEIRHQEFVEDVEPIIAPAELDAFLTLDTPEQRDAFIDDFWRRRDALQGRSTTSFRDVYYARLGAAKEQFRNVKADRAKMFLLNGPPAAVVRTRCDRLLQPIEIWKYPHVRGLGQDVRLLFYAPRFSNDYRLWNPIGGSSALSDLLVSDSAPQVDASQRSARRGREESASPYAYVNQIQLECRDGAEIVRAITSMVQARIDLLEVLEPPDMEDEQAQKLLRSAVIATPGAPKLSAELSVAFPTKDGSRTDVQMTLLVPRTEVTPVEVGGVEVYTVDVTGEVLRDGRLWEKYRYRFDFPGDIEGDTLPIVIDRLLRPDDYRSRIKVMDANGGAETIIESDLTVPELFTAEPVQQIATASGDRGDVPVSDAVAAPPVPVEPRLRIIPPPEEIVRGISKVDTVITGDAIKGVEFSLDGRKIAVRRAKPFAVGMDFGEMPHARRIRAVALDENDEPITGDEIVVNAGSDPFGVRIVSPRVAPRLVGRARVEIDVRVPAGNELEALEVYWNERRVATLHDPPFVQSVDIPATDGVGYIRAVAKLKDDALPPIEDVVMINTPAHMEELNVHLVELPTTVMVDGKPASHLTEQAFTVIDEGKPVAISRFEYVKNVPLSIAMAIDTSGSMLSRLDDAQKAGAEFFENVMKKGDKVLLVAFNSEPQIVQRWSAQLADVHAGLARLRAEETTALYDAIVYSLYNFQGIRGQKALVVISDGKDTASQYTFDQTLDYARRAGIPIYAIGIGIRGTEVDVRHKLNKLTTDTGGGIYYIEQARDLQRVYGQIQTELRSQYILGFYPPPDVKPGKWREVTVRTTEGKVKTVRGYYP